MVALEQIACLEILSFVLGGILFVGTGAWIGKLLRPHNPSTDKLSTYESGEAPVESAWKPFNPRFYIIAVAFLLFEVETILLIPWAVVWNEQATIQVTEGLWVYYAVISATLFVTLLMVGLLYIWGEKILAYEPPSLPTVLGPKIPRKYYEQINKMYSNDNTKIRHRRDHLRQAR